MTRASARGALLLELILAVGLLTAGAMAVFASLRQVSATQTEADTRLAAADLAHSAASLLESGLASPTTLNGSVSWPADLLTIDATADGESIAGTREFWLETSLDPDVDALVLVRVFGPLGPDADAPPLAETVAVLPPRSATP